MQTTTEQTNVTIELTHDEAILLLVGLREVRFLNEAKNPSLEQEAVELSQKVRQHIWDAERKAGR